MVQYCLQMFFKSVTRHNVRMEKLYTAIATVEIRQTPQRIV